MSLADFASPHVLTLERTLAAPRAAPWRCWSAEDREAHEQMGFHEGWGQVATQLEALAQTLQQ